MPAPKKSAFMLSDATLMIGQFGSTPVFDLTPDLHGVGLSEEIAINVDSSNLELTAGIAQAIVDTHRTNVQAGITGSVKEYTAENLLRAQGLATGAVQPKRAKLTVDAAGGAVSLTIQSYPIPGEAASALDDQAAAIPSGATLLIQSADGTDYVFPTRAAADSTFAGGAHTVSIAGNYKIPVGMSFKAGSSVWVLTEIPVGSIDQNDLFSVKIAGTLSQFNRPVVAVFPKVSVTKGFNLSFTHKEYGAMPWELRPMLLTSTEAIGRLAEIGTKAPGKVYAA
jgi:hypothetical protein